MYFPNIPVIPYEGPNSTNPLAFKEKALPLQILSTCFFVRKTLEKLCEAHGFLDCDLKIPFIGYTEGKSSNTC